MIQTLKTSLGERERDDHKCYVLNIERAVYFSVEFF